MTREATVTLRGEIKQRKMCVLMKEAVLAHDTAVMIAHKPHAWKQQVLTTMRCVTVWCAKFGTLLRPAHSAGNHAGLCVCEVLETEDGLRLLQARLYRTTW